MIYAIGTPGQSVRMFIDLPNDSALASNVLAGEIAVEVQSVGDFIISQSGDGVEPRPVPIDEARLARWGDVKAIRQRAENAGCVTPWGIVQTDSESQSRIASAALSAFLAQVGYQRVWTFADNTTHTLGADDLKALNGLVQSHVEACRTRARELRTAIYASNDPSSIDINTGWP